MRKNNLKDYSTEYYRIKVWLVLSFLLYITIEAMSTFSVSERAMYLLTHMDGLLINYVIILIITSPCLLFPKTLFVFNLCATSLLLLTFISRIMQIVRGIPLRWADLFIAKEGLSIASKYITPGLIGGAIVLLGGAVFFLHKTYPLHIEIRKQKLIICFLAVMSLTNAAVIAQVQKVDELTEIETVAEVSASSSDLSYDEEGFIYGFLSSYEKSFNYQPVNYNKEEMEEIKEVFNKEGASKSEVVDGVVPNIIFLQVESFVDPYSLQGVTYSKDPIPCMRPYMETSDGGTLRMPDMNTARTEFEVLTGIRIVDLFKYEVPYTSSKLDGRPIESVAQLLRQQGYYTAALHDHEKAFYKREENYPLLGFDQFISIEAMENIEYTANWPKDKVLLPYMKEVVERTQERDFLFTVTVGTHSSYSYEYENPDKEITLGGEVTPEALCQLQDYIDRLYETDAFVGDVIEWVESLDEPTVLAVYGDHIPALDVIIYDKAYPKFDVPYFVVSNFDMVEGTDHKEIPLPAYELYPEIFNRLGLSGGIITKTQQAFKGTDAYLDTLNEVGYDLLMGDAYLLEEEKPYVKTDLLVGRASK